MNSLQENRLNWSPELPLILEEICCLKGMRKKGSINTDPKISEIFPKTSSDEVIYFERGEDHKGFPIRVGILFSGGQASGGHNVITGLFDALKKIHPHSQLFGFLGGPNGLVEGDVIELNEDSLAPYRNMGGFDLIGSGRDKIETEEQFRRSKETVERLNLEGLVIVGGDDSNTNAAYLAEYFKKHAVDCTVAGVPKTIDGDLKTKEVEISFGFDTACKTYCELIGNIGKDLLSAKKQYAFIKLMGRSASHVTLECALQIHPNLALIGEDLARRKMTLQDVVNQIVSLIIKRAKKGKHYGMILIPEGIIEFVSDGQKVINELDLDKDPHGNVLVSKIETERLLIEKVQEALDENIPFSPQPFFMGYEGRSGFPSNFDANYCYALGHVAALIIREKASGYMASLQGLKKPPQEWLASF
ncbi:diphosphate--fructose-6-phosphate 1-phosphotransferase [Chlamydiales bacterium]|nr:diphosphate--fructose-6-phosphate 1-phosphotransferase [Chlamydiales bacterium]